MDGFGKLPRRFRWRRRTADEIRGDVDEEIAFHLDMRTQELMREGIGPEEARAEALRAFGDVEAARRSLESADKADERRRGRAEWLGDVRQDVHYAIRVLRKSPGFAAVAVVTLALGIGATTATYSVVDGVLLTPLPFEEPNELVAVWEQHLARARDRNPVSPASYIAWTERAGIFEYLTALGRLGSTLTGRGEPRRVGVVSTSASLFPMLGVQAEIGRVYTAAEDVAGAPRLAVLSHGFWERQFGGDAQVVGRTITLNGEAVTVIGVLPAGFGSAIATTFHWGDPDIWMPGQFDEHDRASSGRFLQVLGRLGPDITVGQAQDRMNALVAQLARDAPERHAGWGINVIPLHVQAVGDVREGLLLILGAVTFVLLIACANVANLLLVRATSRRREFAVRSALGASRWRTVRQLLTESILLSGTGLMLGLFVSWAAVRGLIGLAPNIPRLGTVGVDASVLAFALVVSMVTGLAFGLLPALRGGDVNLTTSLKEGGAPGGTPGLPRTRAGLAVAEIGLSLVLLMGAGLLIRSFANLAEVDLGFDPDQLLVADVLLEDASYAEPPSQARFFDELVGRARRLPGVRSASAITWPPFEGGAALRFWTNDRPVPMAEERPVADMRWVDRDYHRTMGIPLLAGRFFDETDTRNAPLRVVISRQVAGTFWPNESAVGKSVSLPWEEDTRVAEIIGVVDDIRDDGPTSELTAMLYWHHQQFHPFNFMSLVVRTTGEPLELVPALRAELMSIDSDLPLSSIGTMESTLANRLARPRFAMLVLGVFALVALSLACVGIYGVVAYAVRQRSREFGIRMALGAGRRDVTGLVLKQGAWLIAVALAAGGAATFAVSHVMQRMVFEIGTNDPLTFFGAASFLAIVALLACYIPARRAARVDPVRVLRDE